MSLPRFREKVWLHLHREWTEVLRFAQGMMARATDALENLLSTTQDSSSQNNPQAKVRKPKEISTRKVLLQAIEVLRCRAIDNFVKPNDLGAGATRERGPLFFPALNQKGGRVMRKIAMVNQKGGCGKTTTAINVACFLAGEGKKVLLIDLDPQGHAGLGLGAKVENQQKTIYEVLLGEIPISAAILTLKDNLDIILSDVVLSAFEQIMAGGHKREYKLAQRLADIENNYDYLIIDSPPSVGLLTFNGLVAAEEVIIPVDPSYFSLHGLGKLLETIQIIEEKAEHQISIGILATNIDRRTNFSRDVVETLKDRFPENCFDTIINTCTRLREAASFGKAITDYEKNCAGYRDYQNLAIEILIEETKMKDKGFTMESLLEAKGLPKSPIEREIVFSLEAPENAMVQIAGDFNKWMPESLEFSESQGRPLWHKTIFLRPGTYEYKYLVDGEWSRDPANEETIDDPYGDANSILRV